MSIAHAPSRIVARALQPGESISSWLVRVARNNAFSLHELVTRLIGRSVHHDSTVDFDLRLPTRLARALIERGLATRDEIDHAELAGRLDAMGGFTRPTRPPKWMLAAPRPHRRALSYCPACWSHDAIPFYRSHWRISWVTVCTQHQLALVDRCAVCAEPNALFRSTRHVGWADLPLSTCVHCFADRRRGPSAAALAHVAGWQQALEDGCVEGWVRLSGTPVATPAYLHGVAVILRMLRTTRAGAHLVHLLGRSLRVVELDQSFDRLDLAARATLIDALSRLLHRWPEQFHASARRVELRSSELRDLGFVLPYWLDQEVRAFDRSWHASTSTEEATAAKLLRERAGIHARTIVREWMGIASAKPSLRSRPEPLYSPRQLALPNLATATAEAWLRQALLERVCKVLRKHLRVASSMGRPRRPQRTLALFLPEAP